MTGARSQRLGEFEFAADSNRAEVLKGLFQSPKTLPCKLFYDARGAELFDKICDLDEYYLMRTELGILRTNIEQIARALEPLNALLEYGSGASVKTRVLLDALPRLAMYVPIDICESALRASVSELSQAYPALRVEPVCGDYMGELHLPSVAEHTVAFFPGSTIGNLEPPAAREFFGRVRAHCGGSAKLLIGVDLRKAVDLLISAYDDRGHVTADFNLNILNVLNREHGANFQLADFTHRAIWNEAASRIEMHLVSRRRHTVHIGSAQVNFEAGESIVTEHCHKYDLDQFRDLAHGGGFSVQRVWTDRDKLFSVQLLVAR